MGPSFFKRTSALHPGGDAGVETLKTPSASDSSILSVVSTRSTSEAWSKLLGSTGSLAADMLMRSPLSSSAVEKCPTSPSDISKSCVRFTVRIGLQGCDPGGDCCRIRRSSERATLLRGEADETVDEVADGEDREAADDRVRGERDVGTHNELEGVVALLA